MTARASTAELLPDGRRRSAARSAIARREAVVVDQVLPDGHGVAAAAERVDDQFAVGLARAGLRALDRAVARGRRAASPVPLPAAEAGEESVDTSAEMRPVLADVPKGDHGPARSGRPPSGNCWRSRAGPSVACSIRRSDQPRRPSARTCCRFSSFKTLRHAGQRTSQFQAGVNVSGRYRKWPSFQPSTNGRFWTSTEGRRCASTKFSVRS